MRGSEPRVDVALIKTLLAEKRSTREIALAAACDERTIYRYKREASLTVRSNEFSHVPITPERLALIGEYVAEEYPIAFIAQRLHVSEATIRRHFPHAGWTREQQRENARMLMVVRKLPTRIDDIRRYRELNWIAA